jgi:integrase
MLDPSLIIGSVRGDDMAILAECPFCRKKQSIRNKNCICGGDLDRAKRSKKVKYWINYRLPGGKQRRELVGFSVEEARDAEGKRRSQKRENRFFDMLPESKMTFDELAKWYLGQTSVESLGSFDRVKGALKNFNDVFGDFQINEIRQTDLEDYQLRRKKQGRAAATIDMEIKYAQTAVIKAYDNDLINGRCIKAFRKTKRLLEKGANVRKTTVSIRQYLKLLEFASPHYKAVLTIAFNTGMRLGEIRQLKWSYIDWTKMMIRLPKEVTKEGRAKDVPINWHVESALKSLPRSILSDFVITYRGKPLKYKYSLKKQFSEVCKRAKIAYGRKATGGIVFHDIRRTFKTNMMLAGVDKNHRDAILGHSLKGMDVHYIVVSDDSLTRAIDRYTKWFDSEVVSASVDQNVDQNVLNR